jgi:hypothetical protein
MCPGLGRVVGRVEAGDEACRSVVRRPSALVRVTRVASALVRALWICCGSP